MRTIFREIANVCRIGGNFPMSVLMVLMVLIAGRRPTNLATAMPHTNAPDAHDRGGSYLSEAAMNFGGT